MCLTIEESEKKQKDLTAPGKVAVKSYICIVRVRL